MKSLKEAQEFWDNRYQKESFIYGNTPNDFFKEQLDLLTPGKLLLPAAGEGRNAVYAAQQGWKVDAFDISQSGQQKALKLAEEKQVSINYFIDSYEEVEIVPESYDALGLIYAHMHDDIRRSVHRKLLRALKPGGTLILEAFTEEQLTNVSGGPKDIAMLYNQEKLSGDFESMNITLLDKLNVTLSEGAHHEGDAHIIRLVAKK